MIKKIKAILLLLSFVMVLIHMMVPHHHHELMAEFSKNKQEQVSYAHHHGSGSNHHHDKEDHHSDEKEPNDPNVPQHVHFSTSDSFELLRINKISQGSSELPQLTFTINFLFTWDSEAINDILKYPSIWPERAAISQYEPGANGLRGPPSIA